MACQPACRATLPGPAKNVSHNFLQTLQSPEVRFVVVAKSKAAMNLSITQKAIGDHLAIRKFFPCFLKRDASLSLGQSGRMLKNLSQMRRVSQSKGKWRMLDASYDHLLLARKLRNRPRITPHCRYAVRSDRDTEWNVTLSPDTLYQSKKITAQYKPLFVTR
jgi:hypothetical protein